MLTRRTRDMFWTWVARKALREMSNAAAWHWYLTMGFAYSVEPHLAREN